MVMPGCIGVVHSCRFRAPFQTVQRAESWGAFLALQAFWLGHLVIDNLNVVRSIGRMLDCGSCLSLLRLVKDGDLIAIIRHMILAQGLDTVKVTRVKGNAAEATEALFTYFAGVCGRSHGRIVMGVGRCGGGIFFTVCRIGYQFGVLFLLASVGLPRLHGCDACTVSGINWSSWGNHRQKE